MAALLLLVKTGEDGEATRMPQLFRRTCAIERERSRCRARTSGAGARSPPIRHDSGTMPRALGVGAVGNKRRRRAAYDGEGYAAMVKRENQH